MSESKPHNLAEIEELLASRQKLMGWLDRLDEAGPKAPRSVRAKVQADYRARLAQVVSQLSTHGDLIGSALDGRRAESLEFGKLRNEEEEVRAEAELRHAVGEYSDDEWQLVELESSGKIDEFDQELSRLGGEVHRLEEVQGLITPSEEPTPVETAPPPEPEIIPEHFEIQNPPVLEDAPTLQLVREPEPELQLPTPPPEAPKFTPRGGAQPKRDSGASRAIPFPPSQAASASASTVTAPQDELAFLRSVTLETPTPQARPATPAAAEREERVAQPMAKTLKCAECGSLNRPTEWYCERCGAELAAL